MPAFTLIDKDTGEIKHTMPPQMGIPFHPNQVISIDDKRFIVDRVCLSLDPGPRTFIIYIKVDDEPPIPRCKSGKCRTIKRGVQFRITTNDIEK